MPRLTEADLDIIAAAARPLDPQLQRAFAEAVIVALKSHTVIGEGLIHRICRDLQRQFLRMPSPQQIAGGKYS